MAKRPITVDARVRSADGVLYTVSSISGGLAWLYPVEGGDGVELPLDELTRITDPAKRRVAIEGMPKDRPVCAMCGKPPPPDCRCDLFRACAGSHARTQNLSRVERVSVVCESDFPFSGVCDPIRDPRAQSGLPHHQGQIMSSTAIQVFPSGKCYTYEGDIHGPATQRRLKVDYQRAARWRKGTAKEWKAIKVQTLAEMYVSRDVLACMSALVDDLIKEDHEGFQVDDMTNLTPDPSDWDITECEAYCDEHGIDTADAIGLSGYRDLVRDNAEQAEVYEWWLVTKWLHGKLSAIGEVTIDNGYGYFWGRCTTGQSMIMDGVFQRIAQEFAEN